MASVSTTHPPPRSHPKDLSHHFSVTAKNRVPSIVKSFYKFFTIPGIGNFAGGLPNVDFFPFDTLEAQVARPDRWAPTPNDPPEDSLSAKLPAARISPSGSEAASHITVPKAISQTDVLRKIDLATALQYGTAEGYPPLKSFIRQFTRDHLHDVPYQDGPEVVMTVGSTDGFSKALDMIVDPWDPAADDIKDRPGMLTDVFIYNNGPATAVYRGVQVVPVEVDSEGTKVHGKGGLKDVLENWDPSKGRRPHFMYTVTIGHNPTGGVQSVQRRREIYALACKYDFLIIEDDPYWFLQFPSAAVEEARVRGSVPPRAAEPYERSRSSGYEFLDSLVPSFLSFDTEGRVIRLDTFSKTIAPGCRLGWITAQPAFIERITRATETSTQQPSGFVQGMVAELIMGPQQQQGAVDRFRSLSRGEQASFSGWNMDGWVRWVAGLRGVYERRMKQVCEILDEGAFQLKQSTPVRNSDADWGVITKTRLLTFDWPRGGMFVWIRVHFEEHPLFQGKGETVPMLDGPNLALALFVFLTHEPYRVLLGPGNMFGATPELGAARGWQYLRLCFAAEDEDRMMPLSKSMVDAIQKFWKIKDKKEIESLIAEASEERVEDMEDVSVLGYGMGC